MLRMLRPSRLLAAFVVVTASLGSCGEATPEPPAGSRQLTIPSTGGSELQAVEVGNGSDVVVLSHGATGTKEDFYVLAESFADDGWRAIAFDARQDAREDDLRAVVDYARETGATSVVLAGGSLGASLSISMATELDAQAVVSLSAPAGAFDALAAAGSIGDSIPVFVAVAEDNEPYATDAQRIADALGTDATVVSGNGHGAGVLRDHPDLIVAIVAFSDEAVGRS